MGLKRGAGVKGVQIAGILADQPAVLVLNRTVIRSPVSETTSLWARPMWAGLTVGYFRDADELRAKWAVGGTWDAAFRGSGTGKGVPAVEKAVTPSLDWAE